MWQKVPVLFILVAMWLLRIMYSLITDWTFKVLITLCSLCSADLPPVKKLLKKEWGGREMVWSHQQCPFRGRGRPFWFVTHRAFIVSPHTDSKGCEGEWTFQPFYSVHTPGSSELPTVVQMPPLQFNHYPGCAVTNPHSTNPAHFTHFFSLAKLDKGSESVNEYTKKGKHKV